MKTFKLGGFSFEAPQIYLENGIITGRDGNAEIFRIGNLTDEQIAGLSVEFDVSADDLRERQITDLQVALAEMAEMIVGVS